MLLSGNGMNVSSQIRSPQSEIEVFKVKCTIQCKSFALCELTMPEMVRGSQPSGMKC